MLRLRLPNRALTLSRHSRLSSTLDAAGRAQHNDDSLQGLHAVVTGASRGIGLAVAHSLAERGASLTLISRSASTLESAVQSLAHPSRHRYEAGDVGDRAFWAGLRLSSRSPSAGPQDERQSDGPSAGGGTASDGKTGPRIDVLVNAAGIAQNSLFLRATEDSVEDVLRTNLLGAMWACRWAGRAMMRQRPASADADHQQSGKLQRGRGVIVNVASLLAVQGGVGSVAYAASKAGVVGFTRALAAELGPAGIRVNTVLPGYVETDMTDVMADAAREHALSRIPLKRFATTAEIADAVIFLVRNAYAHNCILNLDGGLSAT